MIPNTFTSQSYNSEQLLAITAEGDYNFSPTKDINIEFIYGEGQSLIIDDDELRKQVFQVMYDNTRRTAALFPEDLWSWYWLAYAEMETKKYDDALAHWEHIISEPLSRCMETLPNVYRQAAKCYSAKGDTAKNTIYNAIADGLRNEHELIVTNYLDMK